MGSTYSGERPSSVTADGPNWSTAQIAGDGSDGEARAETSVELPLSPLVVGMIGAGAGLLIGAVAVWVLGTADPTGAFAFFTPPLLLIPCLLGAAAADPAAQPGAGRAVRVAGIVALTGTALGPGVALLASPNSDLSLGGWLFGLVFGGPFVLMFGFPVVLVWVGAVRLLVWRGRRPHPA